MMIHNAQERRKYINLRKLVDNASPLHKATIRWGARNLEPDSLNELEIKVSRKEIEPQLAICEENRKHVFEMFESATQEQKNAIFYIVRKVGPAKVTELEELVRRYVKVLGIK